MTAPTAPQAPAAPGHIDVYGKLECPDTNRTRALLDKHGVAYAFHDVEAEPENHEAAVRLSGRMQVPVVRFADGSVVVEPTDEWMSQRLGLGDVAA